MKGKIAKRMVPAKYGNHRQEIVTIKERASKIKGTHKSLESDIDNLISALDASSNLSHLLIKEILDFKDTPNFDKKLKMINKLVIGTNREYDYAIIRLMDELHDKKLDFSSIEFFSKILKSDIEVKKMQKVIDPFIERVAREGFREEEFIALEKILIALPKENKFDLLRVLSKVKSIRYFLRFYPALEEIIIKFLDKESAKDRRIKLTNISKMMELYALKVDNLQLVIRYKRENIGYLNKDFNKLLSKLFAKIPQFMKTQLKHRDLQDAISFTTILLDNIGLHLSKADNKKSIEKINSWLDSLEDIIDYSDGKYGRGTSPTNPTRFMRIIH